jgi:hypothetical protein
MKTNTNTTLNERQAMAFTQTRAYLTVANLALEASRRPIRSQSFPMVRREVRHG